MESPSHEPAPDVDDDDEISSESNAPEPAAQDQIEEFVIIPDYQAEKGAEKVQYCPATWHHLPRGTHSHAL